ncbi:MAG: hypothetical protein [Caudoviricetes sp.]|nr:MAG: hypothetical protein [Caudoviricetes sp.]
MFDFRNCKELVDWADTILVGWIKDNAKKYDSFQDMVSDISANPYAISLGIDDYATLVSAEESFMRVARISDEVWAIFIESTRNRMNASVHELYRQFLLYCISCDIEGYERIWSKYHG